MSGFEAPPSSRSDSPGRLASVYRAIRRGTPQLDLQILGKVLLHAALVGAAAGVIGAAFVASVEWLEHAVLGELAGYKPLCAAGETCPQPSTTTVRWYLFLVLPALGAALAGVLVQRVAPETLGGGADAVIEAFHTRGGSLRKRVAPAKLLASILTLGFGGSGGREGPTMQMGGAVGSVVGKMLRVPTGERRLLLVAGMAAGIAAVFRTPLGAALLAVEVLHRDDFESDALVPAVLASVVGYSVFTIFFGEGVLFAHAPAYPFVLRHLPFYGVLAVVAALTGRALASLLAVVRNASKRLPMPPWLRPAVGGLALGIIAVPALYGISRWLPVADGQRFGIVGGGYGAAQLSITGAGWMPAGLQAALLLAALAALKLVATACTVGTGGSAGDFGPSLTLGALVGGSFGMIARMIDPTIDPGAFALVGMATLYGGIAHVPLAAVVLVCELAGTYDLLVPLMLCAGVAFVLCRGVSLYDTQRRTRRDSPAHAGDLDVLRTIRVRDILVPDRPFKSFERSTPSAEVLRVIGESVWQDVFPVLEDKRLVGVITSDVLRMFATSPELGGIAIADDLMHVPVAARLEDDLHTALSLILEHGLREVVVVDRQGAIVGFMDESEIGSAYHRATENTVETTGTPLPKGP